MAADKQKVVSFSEQRGDFTRVHIDFVGKYIYWLSQKHFFLNTFFDQMLCPKTSILQKP